MRMYTTMELVNGYTRLTSAQTRYMLSLHKDIHIYVALSTINPYLVPSTFCYTTFIVKICYSLYHIISVAIKFSPCH